MNGKISMLNGYLNDCPQCGPFCCSFNCYITVAATKEAGNKYANNKWQGIEFELFHDSIFLIVNQSSVGSITVITGSPSSPPPQIAYILTS